ncbi:sulfite exporter TauE/SafE family protein, partial [Acinetobacter baumannii]
LKSWGPTIFVGVLAGTAIAGFVRGAALTAIFAVMATIVAVYMAFGRPHWRIADHLPAGILRHGIAAFIGAVSAMMGIGGGTLSVPTLTLF